MPELSTDAAKPARLIVLDDDEEMRNMLRRFLTTNGFDVRAVEDSHQLDACLARQPYDLLVLDIMMRGEDGLSVCKRLRSQGVAIPILMLTARGDPADAVVGLELGSDDYLAKPFLPGELVARIRAILRRQLILGRSHVVGSEAMVASEAHALRFGPFRLDLIRQELSRDGEVLAMALAEMRLICALAATPNRAVSRDNLIERARGREYGANARSVDVQVLRLRQIVEEQVSAPRFIRTVWGAGYMLVAEVEV